MEQGLYKLSNKKIDFFLIVKETILSSLVIALPRSPLGNSFFNNPSLILPNLFSSDTSIPFL